MPALILAFLLTIPLGSLASSKACMPLFSTRTLMTVLASKINASQDSLGYEYSKIKTFKQAGIDPTKTLSELTEKELKNLKKNLLKELDGIPVVIAPNGTIFMTDGHHDMFMLSQVEPQLQNISLNVEVAASFHGTSLSMADFKKLALTHNWFYGSIDSIVDHPKKVSELSDNIERSQMGLVFRYILDTYNVPFKGKHFFPFIQFKVIDILKNQNLYNFSGTDPVTIKNLTDLVLKNPSSLHLLLSELRPTAPQELKDFLSSH